MSQYHQWMKWLWSTAETAHTNKFNVEMLKDPMKRYAFTCMVLPTTLCTFVSVCPQLPNRQHTVCLYGHESIVSQLPCRSISINMINPNAGLFWIQRLKTQTQSISNENKSVDTYMQIADVPVSIIHVYSYIYIVFNKKSILSIRFCKHPHIHYLFETVNAIYVTFICIDRYFIYMFFHLNQHTHTP